MRSLLVLVLAALVMSAQSPVVVGVAAATERPANGAVLVRRGSGPGVFRVTNGTDRDAAVSLADGRTAVRLVYVRARSTARVTRIPDGTYVVYVQQGAGWDPKARRFSADADAARFDRSAAFTSPGTRYTAITVTLQPVRNGNARLDPVRPEEIPR